MLVAEGSAYRCMVDLREVFAPAVAHRASAVILAHNHPSGDPTPSEPDLALTRQVIEAGRALCIQVMDHLVVGAGHYISMMQHGLCDFSAGRWSPPMPTEGSGE